MTAPWIAAFVLLSLIVCLDAFVTAGLLRRSTGLLESVQSVLDEGAPTINDGVPVGSRLPGFTAKDRDGRMVDSSQIVDRAGALLMLSPTCEPCQRLVADLGSTNERLSIPVHVVSDAAFPTAEETALRRASVEIFYQEGDAVSRALDTASTPHAFVFDRGGVVASKGFPNTFSDLARLIGDAFGEEVTHRDRATRAGV
jgi:AhpC/TSA family